MSQPRRNRKKDGFKTVAIPGSSAAMDQERQREKRASTRTYQLKTLPSGRRGQERFRASSSTTVAPPGEEGADESPPGQDDPLRENLGGAGSEMSGETLATTAKTRVTKKRNNKVSVAIFSRYVGLTAAKERISTWLPSRGLYLDELLRHDGLGDHHGSTLCDGCSDADMNVEAHFRCRDCSGSRMLCRGCLLREHTLLPLHRVEVRPVPSSSVSATNGPTGMVRDAFHEDLAARARSARSTRSSRSRVPQPGLPSPQARCMRPLRLPYRRYNLLRLRGVSNRPNLPLEAAVSCRLVPRNTGTAGHRFHFRTPRLLP